MGSTYDWLRGLHILAVIAWMAALLYLPRLYAYHTRAARGSEMDLPFQEMERKLLRIIMNPAMVVSLILGAGPRLFDLDVRTRDVRRSRLTSEGRSALSSVPSRCARARRRSRATVSIKTKPCPTSPKPPPK